MIYFTADLHLGHGNIIRHCGRPFASPDEMDKKVVRNWNECVAGDDEVYILGDLTMKPAPEAHDYLTKMNGRKYLVRGNHDKFLEAFGEWMGDFVWVKDYFVLRLPSAKLVLFHYPISEWDGFFSGSVHLFGHVHNNAFPGVDGLAFNVGVDLWDYRPVSLDEITRKAAGCDYSPRRVLEERRAGTSRKDCGAYT